MMKSSVKETLESLRQHDACERFKDKSSSLPSRLTSRAQMPSIRQSLPANFRNAIAPESETKEKEEMDWRTGQILESPYTVEKEEEEEKKGETEVIKISTAQMGPAKNPHEYFFREKLRVWCRVANGQWHLGKIQSTSGDDVCVMFSSTDEVVKVSMEEIFPANPDILEGVEDLIQLSYLNEPSVLYNLRVRYSQDLIYSKAGRVLIAVNPFKNVQIYGKEFLSTNQNKALDAPHVYAVADAAYDEMMRAKKNQSIVISTWKHLMEEAFNIVQIPQEYQERAFALLAAVLWLGNVSFKVVDNENYVEVVADEAVTNVATLMGCNSKDLMVVLSTCKLQAGRDCIAKRLTLRQATDMRDSLAKTIYASLFNWLVEQINISLEVGNSRTGRSISILDIYGFESFKNNSFEQFCINYANERLQQHFNRHLFKLEQEEYEGDGIDWTKVEFKDNQECLNLIEKKPLGLVSLLDEESNFPKATDTTFANKLNQHLKANSCFKGERGRGFRVSHYAGEVLYDTNGFLEKNRDLLHVDLIQLLSSCKCQLLNLFSTKMRHKSLKPATVSDSMNQSVITKFKGQLVKLMNKLEDTTPHFIRCIKPNSKQLPGLYDENHVLQQLRCCGVLEIVRISRSGYPTRLTHQDLAVRYGFILLATKFSQDPLSTSNAILKQYNLPPEMYQVGYRKIYLRTGLIGALEERKKYFLCGILGLQKKFRGYQTREYYHKMRNAAVILQSYIRGENARRNYIVVGGSAIVSPAITGELDAAIHLQYMVRKWLARRHLNSMQQKKKSCNDKKRPRRTLTRRDSEDKDLLLEQFQVQPWALADLQSRVQKVEAAIMQKEDENTALQEELQRFEERWLEHETKMKSMEETWQKHMSSMQMSLAAACKILAPKNTASHGNDSEDTLSFGTPTNEPKGSLSDANNLSSEFDQRSVIINEDAKSLVEVDLRPDSISNRPQHAEELRRLKLRFEKWKKDYKARLREAKARLRLNGVEGRHRKWLCKKSC